MLASEFGRLDVLRLTINEGAYLLARDKNGFTTLIVSVQFGHTEIARLFIQEGVNCNANNTDGGTALCLY